MKMFDNPLTFLYPGQTRAQRAGVTEFPYYEYDSNGKETYVEDSDGYWSKYEYDSNGKRTYYENINGSWLKSEYDANGNKTYEEDNHGYWEKREYNDNNDVIRYMDSDGFLKRIGYSAIGEIAYQTYDSGELNVHPGITQEEKDFIRNYLDSRY